MLSSSGVFAYSTLKQEKVSSKHQPQDAEPVLPAKQTLNCASHEILEHLSSVGGPSALAQRKDVAENYSLVMIDHIDHCCGKSFDGRIGRSKGRQKDNVLEGAGLALGSYF